VAASGANYRVFFAQVEGVPVGDEVQFLSLEQLAAGRADLAPSLAAIIAGLEPHLMAIPYLHLGENDYIYRFRVERERNHEIYAQDPAARILYESQLCESDQSAESYERALGQPPGHARFRRGALRHSESLRLLPRREECHRSALTKPSPRTRAAGCSC